MIVLHKLDVPARLSVQDLQFMPAQLTMLLGENGAGKSTLLSALAGIDVSETADISVRGAPLQDWPLVSLATFRAWLGQHTHSHFSVTVEETLSFFAEHHHEQKPHDWLAPLEIEPFMSRKLDSLSGGEFQRVQLARVLLQAGKAVDAGKAIILLDEPLAALDLRFQYAVMDLLKLLSEKGNCVVLSSHHPEFANQYADQVIMLKKGNVIACGTPSQMVNPASLKLCYGIDLASLSRFGTGNNKLP